MQFRIVVPLVCLISIGFGFGHGLPAAESSSSPPSKTYFVSNAGSDDADGLTAGTSWASISRVNAAGLKPGDTVLFRAGDVWREMLRPAASGTEELPITYGAYGTGARPRISGTAATAPEYNPIRNATFLDYDGIPDDGIADQLRHFYLSGGHAEIVTDAPAGSRLSLKLQPSDAKAQMSFYVFLPADSLVTLHWQARSMHSDGAIAIRHELEGPDAIYLQDDLQSWSHTPDWNIAPLAGTTNGPWTGRSVTFRTDRNPGAYQVHLMSANASAGSATSLIAALDLRLKWQPYSPHTYRLPTGYAPRRIIVKGDNGWQTALDAAEFGRNRENLNNHEWTYDPLSGQLYFRDDAGDGQQPSVEVDISFPQTASSGQCGILIDVSHIKLDSLAVTAWPFEHPSHEAVSGIAISADAEHVSISNCLAAHNFRIGIGTRQRAGIISDSIIAYNGGTGLLLGSGARDITVRSNEVMYNGFWGLSGDDGEGIALGAQSFANLVEWNDVHHNNRHPESWNHGAIILYHTRDNIVRYNTVHDNYKAGVVIDGQNNQFYYNLVFNSGIGYADSDAYGMCNLQLRNDSNSGAGGNRVLNNVFHGGQADIRWMGNIFIKDGCTDSLIRNNVVWGYQNQGHPDVQIRVDGGTDMTGTVISHNLIGPEDAGFIHYLGVNYDSLTDFQSATGQCGNCIKAPPKFSNPKADNFHPLDSSPLIDAGMQVGLTVDLEGIGIEGAPNVGVYELALANSPPQIMAVADKMVAANQKLLFYVQASDANADPLSYSAQSGNGESLAALGAEFAEVLYGDFNADQLVDSADMRLLLNLYNSRKGDRRYDPQLDLNSDDRIDYLDFDLLRAWVGATVADGRTVGRFVWVPDASQVDLALPLTISATDQHNTSTHISLSIVVTEPVGSVCTADINSDGSVNSADLTARRKQRQQEYQNWLADCYTPRLSCGDMDGNSVIDVEDQQAYSRSTWQIFDQWVRDCWQPNR